jgi:hypothetical protein
MLYNKWYYPVKISMLNKNSIFVILIMISGFLARLINIKQPLLEMTMWRQCETASIARNFYYDGMNIFYPQVLWGGGTEGYIGETEFHLYPFVVALLYKVFGVHEYLGRLVSIFAFAGGAFFLYKLARKYIGAQGALIALLFYTYNPHIFFFSRAFQPESTMLFFSITLIYFFSQWLDTEKWQYLILMILCGICAFLVKILTVCLGLPLLYLCIAKYRWKFFLEWKLWLFAFLTLFLTSLWYIHSYKLGSLNGLTWDTFHVGTREGGFVGWSFLTSSYFYKKVFYVYIFQRHLIYIGAVLTIAGIFFAIKKKDLYLFHFWFLSQIVLYFVAAETSRNHSYYSMPIIIPSSIFIGWIIVTYFDRIKRCKLAQLPNLEKYFIAPVFILMLIILPFICFHKITAKYKKERLEKDLPIYIAGNKVREISPKDALVITAHWGGPELLYYSDRRGWVIESRNCSIGSIESLRKAGATWFVTTRVMEINKSVISYLKNKYDIVELTDQYLIAKL